jgi:hypothetical protein
VISPSQFPQVSSANLPILPRRVKSALKFIRLQHKIQVPDRLCEKSIA